MTWWFNEQKYSVIHHATCSAFYHLFQRIKFIFVSYEFPDKLGLIERERKKCADLLCMLYVIIAV